jgi:hypothetical protein
VKKYSQHLDDWLTVTLDSVLVFLLLHVFIFFLAFVLYYLSMVNQTKYAYFLVYHRALNKRTNNPFMISRSSPRRMIGVTLLLIYFQEPVGWPILLPNREKLYLFRDKIILWRYFLHICMSTVTGMHCLPYRWVLNHSWSQEDQSFSVRVCI